MLGADECWAEIKQRQVEFMRTEGPSDTRRNQLTRWYWGAGWGGSCYPWSGGDQRGAELPPPAETWQLWGMTKGTSLVRLFWHRRVLLLSAQQ